MTAPAYAPAGWGYRPGMRIDRPTVDDLPDIPGVSSLAGRARTDTVVAAIRSRHGLAKAIKASDIAKRYAIPYVSAWEIYQRCL